MITNLFKQAGLAQASYGLFDTPISILAALQRPDAGFTPTQAARFADQYSLVTQYNDDAVVGTGNATSFSVAVFKDISTNKLTVALKGTLEGGDYVPTDTNIFINGAGYKPPPPPQHHQLVASPSHKAQASFITSLNRNRSWQQAI
jgi:hypothetical protein